MAQYAHLSDPDPEWHTVASSVLSLYTENIVEFRKKFSSSRDDANNQLGGAKNVISECRYLTKVTPISY